MRDLKQLEVGKYFLNLRFVLDVVRSVYCKIMDASYLSLHTTERHLILQVSPL